MAHYVPPAAADTANRVLGKAAASAQPLVSQHCATHVRIWWHGPPTLLSAAIRLGRNVVTRKDHAASP